ncbi:MAG: hypothetical protein Tsb002_16940 [Wenzhouxiangellaceae bacterium]
MLAKLVKYSIVTALLLLSTAAMADRQSASSAVAEAGAFIQAAERAEAGRYAAVELKLARDHLSRARVELEDRSYNSAEDAAIRAKVEAELAAAKTRASKARMALTEMRQTVQTLREELNRQGGQ